METGCKILLIDDMLEMQEMMTLLLSTERNDHVIYARGGLPGLLAADKDPPQLIILDLMMPDLNGYEVVRQLKARPGLQDIPVLMLTVLPSHMVYPEAQRLGIAGYLCKPFEFKDLLAARDALLRGETYFPPI